MSQAESEAHLWTDLNFDQNVKSDRNLDNLVSKWKYDDNNVEVNLEEEQMKVIFDQISKLSTVNDKTVDPNPEYIDGIIKQAQQLVDESSIVFTRFTKKNSSTEGVRVNQQAQQNALSTQQNNTIAKMPVFKIFPAEDMGYSDCNSHEHPNAVQYKANEHFEYINQKKSSNNTKKKMRPKSASYVDASKISKCNAISSLPRKGNIVKNDHLIEELKDAHEKVKSIELQLEALSGDHRVLKCNYDKIYDQNKLLQMKLTESQDLLGKLKREYDNLRRENSRLRESEEKLSAEVAKERSERKDCSGQQEKDKIIIQDLQRQCKEMERILQRKHPDSVSALIVASKPSTHEDNARSLLNARINQLEQDLKDKDIKFHGILSTLQEKFGIMKDKYESHIFDLEKQLIDQRDANVVLKNKINKTNLKDGSMQTDPSAMSCSTGVQVSLRAPDKPGSAPARASAGSSILSARLKEDSHLIATIKGLQAETLAKDRNISKMNRDMDALRKTIKKLQKEREVLLKMKPHETFLSSKQNAKSADNILGRVNSELEAELDHLRLQNVKMFQERDSVLMSLKCLEDDYLKLKKKRIQDLHTLQLAHEKELMQMNAQIYPLQDEIHVLNDTIEILHSQVKLSDDRKYHAHEPREANLVLKDHNNVESRHSNDNVQNKDFKALKQKIATLEKRYHDREMRLKTLIITLSKLQSGMQLQQQASPACDKCSTRTRQSRTHKQQLEQVVNALKGVTSQ